MNGNGNGRAVRSLEAEANQFLVVHHTYEANLKNILIGWMWTVRCDGQIVGQLPWPLAVRYRKRHQALAAATRWARAHQACQRIRLDI